MRGLPIALLVVLASPLAVAGGSTLVSTSAVPGATPAAPTEPVALAPLASLASSVMPAATALAAPLTGSLDDLRALGEAAGAALDAIDGRRMPSLALLTVEPVAQTESSGFGWRADPFRHDRRYHPGTDFRAKSGTPVLAAGPGTVIYAARMHGYGNVVFIDHGGGLVTRYAHMRRILTKRGAKVVAGQELGLVGATGRATGPHLHYEVRFDGRPVDPVEAMAIAELERDTPLVGHVATYALIPAIQREVGAPGSLSVPRHVPHEVHRHHHHHHHTRPERRGHTKHSQPTS